MVMLLQSTVPASVGGFVIDVVVNLLAAGIWWLVALIVWMRRNRQSQAYALAELTTAVSDLLFEALPDEYRQRDSVSLYFSGVQVVSEVPKDILLLSGTLDQELADTAKYGDNDDPLASRFLAIKKFVERGDGIFARYSHLFRNPRLQELFLTCRNRAMLLSTKSASTDIAATILFGYALQPAVDLWHVLERMASQRLTSKEFMAKHERELQLAAH